MPPRPRTDFETLLPMLRQLRETAPPRAGTGAVVDGRFMTCSIEPLRRCGGTRAQETKQLAQSEAYAKKAGDGAGVSAWRARMGTAAAKQIYRLRLSNGRIGER